MVPRAANAHSLARNSNGPLLPATAQPRTPDRPRTPALPTTPAPARPSHDMRRPARASPRAGRRTVGTAQMNSVCAPSDSSMKSVALMMASTPS